MLSVSQEVYETVIDHARRGGKEEVCGVLGGEYGEEHRYAYTGREAENVADTPRSTYRIEPKEQLELMEEIRKRGQDIVGFYHSHPSGPPRPSATDAAQATWPGYSYLIVSLSGEYPFVGSWCWTGERFQPEVLERKD